MATPRTVGSSSMPKPTGAGDWRIRVVGSKADTGCKEAPNRPAPLLGHFLGEPHFWTTILGGPSSGPLLGDPIPRLHLKDPSLRLLLFQQADVREPTGRE